VNAPKEQDEEQLELQQDNRQKEDSNTQCQGHDQDTKPQDVITIRKTILGLDSWTYVISQPLGQ